MIKELGEYYNEQEFEEPDVLHVPRMRHPWPVLKIPNDGIRLPKDFCGVVDQGCRKHAQLDYVPKRRDDQAACQAQLAEDTSNVRRLAKEILGIVNGDEIFVLNDPCYPLCSPGGNVYALLYDYRFWEETFLAHSKPLAAVIPFPEDIRIQIIGDKIKAIQVDEHGTEVKIVQIDDYGVEVLSHGTESHIADKPDDKDETPSELADGNGSEEVDISVEKAMDSTLANTSSEVQKDAEDNKRDQEDAGDDNHCQKDTDDDKDHDEASVASDDDSVDSESDSSQLTVDVKSGGLDNLSTSKLIPEDSPFSVVDIPKLEEDIPKYYLPDILYVHDPHDVTMTEEDDYRYARSRTFKPRAPMVYKRMHPKLSRDSAKDNNLPTSPPREAHLYLAHQNRIGVGHHSLVHHATLSLPAPLSAHSRNGMVKVAAKSAFPVTSARQLLANEGRMYSLFPEHLSQDWCGYNMIMPIKHPVPVGPVIPKFFGYYVPWYNGARCSQVDLNAPSPILLLEDCGDCIEPAMFTPDHRRGSQFY